MYKSPIEITVGQPTFECSLGKQTDQHIYRAVAKVGIDVDKEELIRALNYDREQYQQGYEDGVRDTMREKGEWVHDPLSSYGVHVWFCSQCNGEVIRKTDYCPNCGADMRGEEHESD